MRVIQKFHPLDHGMEAGRYLGRQDVRGYRPPSGYNATADLVDSHPVTGEPLSQSEWWLFLTPITNPSQ